MADNTKLQYIIELLTTGDTKKATEELTKLQAAGTGSANAIGGLTKGFGYLFAVIGGMSAVKQSIDAFLEQEKAIAKLNAALKAAGEFTPELSEEMIKLSDTMAQTSEFADEAILNVIAKLTAAGAKKDDIERLTRAVLDLSTLMDRDLNRATMAFAQALNGETGALKQAGIQIDETKNAGDRLNDVLVAIEKRAGGQSTAIKGLSAEVNQFKKDMDAASEATGGFFLSLYSGLRRAAKDVWSPTALINDLKNATSSGAGATYAPQPGMVLSPESNAALMKMMPRGRVTTPGTDQADELAGLEDKAKLEDEILKTIQAEYDAKVTLQHQADAAYLQQIEDFKNGERIKQDLIDQTVLTVLDGVARERAQLEISQSKRMEEIEETTFATNEQYAQAVAAVKVLNAEETRRFENAHSFAGKIQEDMRQVTQAGEQAFASGLAGAIVSAFEEGDKAFQKFAANFLRQIAQMILQSIILRAVQTGVGSLFGGGGGHIEGAGAGTGEGAAMAAKGGQWTAMAGGGMMVNSPTLLPKFGVLAGEAGPEMLTVLARPRFERINGVPAQIGSAGGARLAITSAAALAGATGGGGAGGTIRLIVGLSPDVKAEVVETSLKNVIVEMHQDSALSRATKKLTA